MLLKAEDGLVCIAFAERQIIVVITDFMSKISNAADDPCIPWFFIEPEVIASPDAHLVLDDGKLLSVLVAGFYIVT